MFKIMLSIIFTLFVLSRIKSLWRGIRDENVPTLRGKPVNDNRRNTSLNGYQNLTAAGAMAGGAAGIVATEFDDISVTNDIDLVDGYTEIGVEINPATGLPMLDDSIDVSGNAYGFDNASMDMHIDCLSTDNIFVGMDDSFCGFDNNVSSFDDSFSDFDDNFSSFDDF